MKVSKLKFAKVNEYADRAIEIIEDMHTERLDYNSEYTPLIDAAHTLKTYEEIGTVEEFAEWKKAQDEGRLVVLPCEFGDTVYVIAKCEYIQMMHDNDYELGTGDITCPFESQCEYTECNDSNVVIIQTELLGYLLDSLWNNVFLEHLMNIYNLNDFGKKIFTNKEAAEKALEGEK